MLVRLGLILLVLLPFQNCLSTQLGESYKPGSSMQGGNGNGYDGKIYVHLSTGQCADAKGYDAAIEGRKGAFYLTREACADIPIENQVAVSVQFNNLNDNHIYYDNRLFVEVLNLVAEMKPVVGGFLAHGTTFKIEEGRLRTGDRYIGVFDHQGRALWSKKFERPFVIERARVSALPGDESVLSLRYSTASTESTVVARLDGAARLKWSQTIGAPDNLKVRFASQQVDATGAIYLAGALAVSDTQATALLVKLDPDGREIFARTFMGTDVSSANVKLAPGGGIYLYGRSGGSFFVMKVSAAGIGEWSHSYPEVRDATFEIADDGAIVLKGQVLVPDVPVTIYWMRYIELDPTDGTVRSSVRFTDDTLSYSYGARILASGDGGFYVSIPGSSGTSVLITRLRRDYSVEWARRVPYTDQLGFSGLERVGADFYTTLMKMSSLAPYGTQILVPTNLKNLPAICTECSTVEVVMEPAPTVTAGPGPSLGALTGLIYSAGTMEPLQDIDIRLPFALAP